MPNTISAVYAREILDSRGNPTVEATVVLNDQSTHSASVPSGASTGTHEALELRDNDKKRYGGKGVLEAVRNVEQRIAPLLKGQDPKQQTKLDHMMIELDGTPNKSKLGANAILAVSIAITRAGAHSTSQKLYSHIANLFGSMGHTFILPIPMCNVLNGGKHASGSSDMQEFMIMPVGAPNFAEAVRWGAETFHVLGSILKKQGYTTTVGDEGGYAPALGSNEKPLQLIVEALTQAGYKAGKDIAIALDPAASSFYTNGEYHLAAESMTLTSDQLIRRYADWCARYPIVSLEDGLYEDDWDGFTKLTSTLKGKTQTVGDDLFVTNVQRLQTGIERKSATAILVKLNQIGSVTETLDAMRLAHKAGMKSVVSHRSGETEDSFIADLAVGTGCGQIKTGSFSRSDRVSKYNRLMAIEKELGDRGRYASL